MYVCFYCPQIWTQWELSAHGWLWLSVLCTVPGSTCSLFLISPLPCWCPKSPPLSLSSWGKNFQWLFIYGGLLVINPLTIFFTRECFIFPSFLKDNFTSDRIQDWQFFLFPALEKCATSFLSSWFLMRIPLSSEWIFPLWVRCHFCLMHSGNFFVFCFSSWVMMLLGVDFFEFYLFWSHWVSWIHRLMTIANLGKFQSSFLE